MKTFVATFWRANDQLNNGGYETTRTIEAKSIGSARKQARELSERCRYGSMTLLDVKPSK